MLFASETKSPKNTYLFWIEKSYTWNKSEDKAEDISYILVLKLECKSSKIKIFGSWSL